METVAAPVVADVVATAVVTGLVGIVVVTGAVAVVSVVVGPLVVGVVVEVSDKAGVAAAASTNAAAMPAIDRHSGIGSNHYRYERETLNRAQPQP